MEPPISVKLGLAQIHTTFLTYFDHRRAEQDMIRANPAVTLRTMLTTSSLLKPLLIAVMMMLAQQGPNSTISRDCQYLQIHLPLPEAKKFNLYYTSCSTTPTGISRHCWTLNQSTQLSGINAAMFFSTSIFESAGLVEEEAQKGPFHI